jgi:hypothetical protein
MNMKKLFILSVAMLMGTLIMFGLFAGGAQAGQDADAWTKVHTDWPWDQGYYKISLNGVVHEKWSCEPNWQDCDGGGLYYPVSKFEDPVLDTPCGADISPRLWEGTVEYLDDEGDFSDFLTIGEAYWFCDTLGDGVFRASE